MTDAILSDLTLGNVTEVVVVLGKRLVDSQLTAEGRSRVDALAEQLTAAKPDGKALMLCGGKLAKQNISEAHAMFHYLSERHPDAKAQLLAERLLIEDQSTTSVENIANAAQKLIESRLCLPHTPVRVVLVSNDYHLERILEIQKLMPEQGLLSRFTHSASKVGLSLQVPLDIEQHIVAPYPHRCEQGQAFLLLDQLTTYRVYLEGVVAQVFERPLQEVRNLPSQIAEQALSGLQNINCMKKYKDERVRLLEIIELTTATAQLSDVRALLPEFNQILLKLNRRLDPEAASSTYFSDSACC